MTRMDRGVIGWRVRQNTLAGSFYEVHPLLGNGFSHSVFYYVYVLILGLHLPTGISVSIIPLPCLTASLASSLLFSVIYGLGPEIYSSANS